MILIPASLVETIKLPSSVGSIPIIKLELSPSSFVKGIHFWSETEYSLSPPPRVPAQILPFIDCVTTRT